MSHIFIKILLIYKLYKYININRMFQSVLTWVVDISMAICPILGYVSQYRLIKVSKSIGSFSIDICGILLFANILRLNFYIFKRYETALVFQSLFMIGMQMVLLFECSKYPQKVEDQNISTAEEIQPALDSYEQERQKDTQFWRWMGFQRYGVTVLFFAFCTFAISGIFKLTPAAKPYGQFVGVLALMSQSILILPQIIRNIQKQSAKGLSYVLVSLNLSGDIFKLTYFVMNNQPFQFILCGVIQVVLDTFVILQIFYYNRIQQAKDKAKKNEPTSPMKHMKIQQSQGAGQQATSQKLYTMELKQIQNDNQLNKYDMNEQIKLQKVEKVQKMQKKISGELKKQKNSKIFSQKNSILSNKVKKGYSKFQDEDQNQNQEHNIEEPDIDNDNVMKASQISQENKDSNKSESVRQSQKTKTSSDRLRQQQNGELSQRKQIQQLQSNRNQNQKQVQSKKQQINDTLSGKSQQQQNNKKYADSERQQVI